jgi:tetratricopeptide (TPR) repeat protein
MAMIEADLLIKQGALCFGQLRFDEAIAAFDEALAIDPKNATALLDKARTLRASKNYVKAESFLAEARDELPENIDIANELGFLFMDRLRYDTAIATFDQALAIDPKNATALQYKARSLRVSKEYVKAQRLLIQARKELPENVDLLNEQAMLYLDELSYDSAIAAFDQALAIDPKNATALQYKARALRASKDYIKAQSFINEARESFPENVDL